MRVKVLLFSLCGPSRSIRSVHIPSGCIWKKPLPWPSPGSPLPVQESPRELVVLLRLSILFEFWLHLTVRRHSPCAFSCHRTG